MASAFLRPTPWTYLSAGVHTLSRGGIDVEWCFETHGGAVRVRQEGERAICQAILGAREDGLYKAWLRGAEGRALLGTLIPQGGALRLRRSVTLSQLRERRAWPPVGADIVMAYPFTEKTPPTGFAWEEHPGRLVAEPLLSQCLQMVGRCFVRKEAQGILLAMPFEPKAPFPIPPLFCLSRVERLEGRDYVLFQFSPDGRPMLAHNFPTVGETGGVV